MGEIRDQDASRGQAANYLDHGLRDKKNLGSWRWIYLQFLKSMVPASVLEAGAGDPLFLQSVRSDRRAAIDLGDRFENDFKNAGMEYYDVDLDRDRLGPIGRFQAVICSDVFEHLANPAFALQSLAQVMDRDSVLFAHVPNEFRMNTIATMLGYRTSVCYHRGFEEWEDPHLRRFTDIGFDKFLAQHFEYRLRIVDLRYTRSMRLLSGIGVKIPFFLEYGPTYIAPTTARNSIRSCA